MKPKCLFMYFEGHKDEARCNKARAHRIAFAHLNPVNKTIMLYCDQLHGAHENNASWRKLTF